MGTRFPTAPSGLNGIRLAHFSNNMSTINIGPAIKRLRNQRKWSQSVLADQLAMNRSSISHLESGKKNPSWDVFARLCSALDVTPAELFLISQFVSTDNSIDLRRIITAVNSGVVA